MKLPSKSWEIFTFARGLLSVPGMNRIFNVEHAQIYRWGKDPSIYDDARRNPIDTVSAMLSAISEAGEEEGRQLARIALNIMGSNCGFKVVDIEQSEPATDSPRAEFLELFNRLHELQAAAQNHEDPLVVEAYADKVANTLSAFLVRYMADYQKRGGNVRFSRTKKTLTRWQRIKTWFL